MVPKQTLHTPPKGRGAVPDPASPKTTLPSLMPAIVAMVSGLLVGGVLIHSLQTPNSRPAERSKVLPIP